MLNAWDNTLICSDLKVEILMVNLTAEPDLVLTVAALITITDFNTEQCVFVVIIRQCLLPQQIQHWPDGRLLNTATALASASWEGVEKCLGMYAESVASLLHSRSKL